MVKKLKAAIAKGAKTDADFLLFSMMAQKLKVFGTFPGTHKQQEMISFQTVHKRQEMILEKGAFFTVAPLPRGFRRGKQKECYGNSWNLAVGSEGALSYCEGFVLINDPLVMDIDHAWCADAKGNVIDITLREMGLSYFGIKYGPDELAVDNLPIIDTLAAQAVLSSSKRRRRKT
jgi:hypothetical protein